MQQHPSKQRTKGSQRDSTKTKEKFLEERRELIKVSPIKAMNFKQEVYMDLLKNLPVVVATGFAGTSKTFLPVSLAADWFRLGDIQRIVITRPAISSSESVGFFKGSATEKMQIWLAPVMPVLKARLGQAALDIAIAKGDIEFTPLEVVKGSSYNDCVVIVEESSDLTKDEVIKMITRMGKNSTLVLAGDVRQSELSGESGLVWLTDFITRHGMQTDFGWVDFDSPDDIVRSPMVKRFIVNLVRDENEWKQGQGCGGQS